MENIEVKILNDFAKLPTYGSEDAAGADLYAATSYDIAIPPHSAVKIGTGLAMKIPKGYFGGIFARSGLASKNGLRPSNCVGVIDADYRGEIIVSLHNDTEYNQYVPAGSRIAQLVILPCNQATFRVVDDLDNTTRGNSGFGSTGLL